MQLADFRKMIDQMAAEIPPQFFEGIADIEVSQRTVPHPGRQDVYTMGECIPIDTGAEVSPARVVLYYGSFQALARQRPGFDWRAEAWETLTHELRHHLEWQARAQDLEQYDWAAEQGFARAEAGAFDPLFYQSGEVIAPATFQVDDDVFLDRMVDRAAGPVEIEWAGRRYRVEVPEARLPLYLSLDGVADPPAGDLILVLRRKPRFTDLFRRVRVTERRARVIPVAPPAR